MTAKNAGGCISAKASVTVTAQPAAPAAPTASVTTQPSCTVATGTITVSSATTGLTFSIDGMTYTNTTGVFNSVAAGPYDVTAKNAGGCVSAKASVTVTAQPAVPAAPTASVTVQPSCTVSTGTITVSSAIAGLTFSIDGTTYTNTTGVFASLAVGPYDVTSKNADGCISAKTSVTVNAQPAAPAAPKASVTVQPSCMVATGTITVSSAVTGLIFSIDGTTYTNTTGVFATVVAGSYDVTAKNVDGCISAKTSVIVTAQPTAPAAPTASVTSQPTCAGPTGIITILSTKTGLSFSIDGSTYTNTTGVFTALAAGSYDVTAKSASGCISAKTSVTLDECVLGVSLFSEANENQVLVYPNPFINSINIQLADDLEISNCFLKLYDVSGNELINKNIRNHSTTLETSKLRSGVYYFNVTNNGQSIQSGKLISK